MSFAIDEAGPVRDGERLDEARLADYLAAQLPAPGTAGRRAVSHTAIRTSRTCSDWATASSSCDGRRSATGSSRPTTWAASTGSCPPLLGL